MAKFKFPKSYLKQIRRKCLDCSGENFDEVKFCGIPDCPLWFFRFGKHPRTVISSKKAKTILFDREAFEEGGIFYPAHQDVRQARKVFQDLEGV